uniref:Uncharacterized protein n=1 Tax=Arundo donax TaxID=35708 RepID=A0A0A9BI77_ARUDO
MVAMLELAMRKLSLGMCVSRASEEW